MVEQNLASPSAIKSSKPAAHSTSPSNLPIHHHITTPLIPNKPHVSLEKTSNLIKIYLFIISFILVQSKWNFAYTKTAKLSWYMQNFIVIGEYFNGLVYINIHNHLTTLLLANQLHVSLEKISNLLKIYVCSFFDIRPITTKFCI